MQPHKSAPMPRKVEVDLSEILIQPDALGRADRPGENEFREIFLAHWKDSSPREHSSRLNSAEWTNLIFAIGGSLAAILCTLSTFDELEQVRRNAYRASVLYASPRLARTADVGIRTRSKPSRVGPLRERVIPSNQVPLSSPFPLQRIPNSPSTSNNELLNNDNSASNVLAAAGSVGQLPPGSSQGSGSSSEGGGSGGSGGSGGGQHGGKSVKPPPKVPRDATANAKSALSGQKSAGSRLAGIAYTSKINKSVLQDTRQSNVSLKQSVTANAQAIVGAPHSMHSIGSGVGTMQRVGPQSCMQMQHGLLGQTPTITGLEGLNHAGLGGGAGHRAARAHR